MSGAYIGSANAGDPPRRFPLDDPGDTPPATLQAFPSPGHRLAGWTLVAGSAGADATARAEFEATPAAPLTVAAGTGGSVWALVAGATTETVAAGSERALTTTTATLTAVPDGDHLFHSWLVSIPPGQPSEGRPQCYSRSRYLANPCALSRSQFDVEARAEAVFGRPASLTVAAGLGGGRVTLTPSGPSPADPVSLRPDSERSLEVLAPSARSVPRLAAATLRATPARGYVFSGWRLSGGLACGIGSNGRCFLEIPPSVAAGARAEAVFELASPGALAVAAGVGGWVAAAVAAAAAVTVEAGSERGFAFSAVATTTLLAMPAPNYRFAGWTLSGVPAPACADGPRSNPCEIAAGPYQARAEAAFDAAGLDLAVAAGPNGSVEAFVSGAAPATVGPGSERSLGFSVDGAATLVAVPAPGYAFAGWTLSGPPVPTCVSGTANRRVCVLAAGSVTADSRAEAAFEIALNTLTVAAGAAGSVRAEVAGATSLEVGADSSHPFAFSVLSTATLTAVASDGTRLRRLDAVGRAVGVRRLDGSQSLRAAGRLGDRRRAGRGHVREGARRMEGPGLGVAVRRRRHAHRRPLRPGRLRGVGGCAMRGLAGDGMRRLLGDGR